jgi:hypothetical protein
MYTTKNTFWLTTDFLTRIIRNIDNEVQYTQAISPCWEHYFTLEEGVQMLASINHVLLSESYVLTISGKLSVLTHVK